MFPGIYFMWKPIVKKQNSQPIQNKIVRSILVLNYRSFSFSLRVGCSNTVVFKSPTSEITDLSAAGISTEIGSYPLNLAIWL
jgi:hypothetical protein